METLALITIATACIAIVLLVMSRASRDYHAACDPTEPPPITEAQGAVTELIEAAEYRDRCVTAAREHREIEAAQHSARLARERFQRAYDDARVAGVDPQQVLREHAEQQAKEA
jgi:cell division septation protein DedD